MNRNVNFIQGVGPVMDPMIPNETVILDNINIINYIKPLEKALTILRSSLPSEICLIGFAGAPWTLACYMIDGGSSKDFIETRKAVWGSNKWFNKLIETLIVYVADILEMQAKAGADVLMIFDSWSHMIPSIFWKDFAINPTKKIIKILRDRKIFNPIIGFPFKGGYSIIDYSYESGVDCIALDWTVDLPWAIKNINSDIVMQGNLDPAALISDNSNLYKNVDFILSTMAEKRFIFNVGHGLTPECKIDNVKAVIKQVKNYRN
jgi:uroporphyrinogen decarboxylase